MSLKEFELEIVQQRFMLKELFKTQQMVREFDICDQKTLPMLYAFKVENENAQAALAQEVAENFVNSKKDVG